MKKTQSIRNARTLLRQSELGVLSTHSKANEGYPFGSVSTYMSTVNGDAIFYISDLAQHTKNLLSDSKMCLTVFSGAEGEKANDSDPNASARLSLLGEASQIDSAVRKATAERFFKLYPESQQYQGTHDFEFFKLNTQRARFIGGFGDIQWINRDNWLLPTPEWLDSEPDMVTHMNYDHRDAMQLICEHHFQIKAQRIEMVTLTPDGFFLRADLRKPLYIPFDRPAFTGSEIRLQLVKLTQAARAALAA